jgi:predicted Kef-type K+ transport protein
MPRHTPLIATIVADQALAPELTEIGVILLMFGVGLHFSLKDLLSVKAIASRTRLSRSQSRRFWEAGCAGR